MNDRRKTLAIFDQLEMFAAGSLGLLDEEELGVGIDDGEIFVKGGSGARVVDVEVTMGATPERPEGIDGCCIGNENNIGNSGEGKAQSPQCMALTPTTWLVCTDGDANAGSKKEGVSPAKPYVVKPSKLKPPSETMNYFVPSAQHKNQQTSKDVDDDSPFTRRIKALEQNPELAFAGSSRLRNDNDDVGAGAGAGMHSSGPSVRPKKKTAAEIQWESWGTDGQLF